jgi:hypothetical protein
MQILTVSDKASQAETAITLFLASAGLEKVSITSDALSSTELDDADCAIYIDQFPNFQVVQKIHESGCSLILIADQDFRGVQCFIPFSILDNADSASIGIAVISDYLDSIATKSISNDLDPNTQQRAPTISQFRQARDDFNFFEALATG